MSLQLLELLCKGFSNKQEGDGLAAHKRAKVNNAFFCGTPMKELSSHYKQDINETSVH